MIYLATVLLNCKIHKYFMRTCVYCKSKGKGDLVVLYTALPPLSVINLASPLSLIHKPV